MDRRTLTSSQSRPNTLLALSMLAAFGLGSVACDSEATSDTMGPSAGGKADEVDEAGDVDTDPEEEDSDVIEVDPEFIDALDVDKAEIELDPQAEAPSEYKRPTDLDVSLGGTEFWQRWTDGHAPTFNFSEGTPNGRKCMQASAIRFEAIMSDPPESVLKLKEATNWSGSFFNWNDDFTQSTSQAPGARLWAWRTSLVKWISQTTDRNTCLLPTLAQVESLAANCLSLAEQNDGEIQGCRH